LLAICLPSFLLPLGKWVFGGWPCLYFLCPRSEGLIPEQFSMLSVVHSSIQSILHSFRHAFVQPQSTCLSQQFRQALYEHQRNMVAMTHTYLMRNGNYESQTQNDSRHVPMSHKNASRRVFMSHTQHDSRHMPMSHMQNDSRDVPMSHKNGST